MNVPSGLIPILENCIPDFDREQKQHGIAAMLWATLQPKRKHKKYTKAYSFSRADLRKLFGSDEKFRQINRDPLARYFSVQRFQNGAATEDDNFTNGYTPTTPMQDALGQFLLSPGGSNLLNDQGKVIQRAPKAISSLDMEGWQVIGWERDDAPSVVRIDIDAVKLLSQYYLRVLAADLRGEIPAVFKYDGREKTVMRTQQIRAILHAASSPRFYGCVLHQYIQSTSGRLFAEGANLQTYSRTIRNTALAGMHDYDLNCCHFAIFYQMAAMYGRDCPAIRYYVHNKHEIRQRIAEEVGITVKQAKTVLTMAAYGAKERVSDKNAIPKEIGREAAVRLYKNKTYRSINDELSEATADIIKHAKKVQGKYRNVFGKLLLKERPSDATIMAHLLQGVEAVALRAAVRTCREDVVLLVHDGFVTSRPVDLEAIHQAVTEATGFSLTFEGEQITSPLPDLEQQFRAAHIKVMDLSEPNVHAGLRRVLGGGTVTVEGDATGEQVVPMPPVYPDPINPLIWPAAF